MSGDALGGPPSSLPKTKTQRMQDTADVSWAAVVAKFRKNPIVMWSLVGGSLPTGLFVGIEGSVGEVSEWIIGVADWGIAKLMFLRHIGEAGVIASEYLDQIRQATGG